MIAVSGLIRRALVIRYGDGGGLDQAARARREQVRMRAANLFAQGVSAKDVAALQSRLMLDAPTGDLAIEQALYDADRVRGQEATELGRGHRSYSTAGRHDATGQIVARTKLSFETGDDAHARQRVTIVEPAHRGRRLGLIVKSANHAYTRTREPALRVMDAYNAEENTHMRAVNARLGFQPVDSWPVFQLPVPDAQPIQAECWTRSARYLWRCWRLVCPAAASKRLRRRPRCSSRRVERSRLMCARLGRTGRP